MSIYRVFGIGMLFLCTTFGIANEIDSKTNSRRLLSEGDKQDWMFSSTLDGRSILRVKHGEVKPGPIGFYADRGMVRFRDIVVSGQVLKSPKTLRKAPEPRDFIFVCRDAGAGGYEAFPDVCRRKDGRLMVVFYAGYGHVSLPNQKYPKGGRISYCTSKDEGRTWSKPNVLYDGPFDDRDPSITQLSDGRLMCNFFALKKDKKREYSEVGLFLLTSSDLGKTWSGGEVVKWHMGCSSPVREVSPGRLFLGLYGRSSKKNDLSSTGWVARSNDVGKSWEPIVEMDNCGVDNLDAETDIIPLRDGSLFAALRGKRQMWWSRSTDMGETWSKPITFGHQGHCPYLHRAENGIIVLGYRSPWSSTNITYSIDETKSWSEPIIVDAVPGAYPSMVNLKDGSILVVYYDVDNIRARRFRVTKSGVKWLSLSDKMSAK